MYMYADAKIAAAFLEEIDDAVVTTGNALAGKNSGFTCGPGCSHCCRLPVEATYPEGALAAGYIRENLAHELGAIRLRLESWARWSRAGIVDMLADGMAPVRAYLYHGPGCPFLADGLCAIYPVRPAGCRVHNSTKDPSECMPPEEELPVFFNPGNVRAVNEAVRPVILNYMRGLDEAGLDVTRPVEPLPLIVLAGL
jgi:Fe-S-cluster containining protein